MTEVMTSLPTSLLIYLAIEQTDMGKDTTAFRERFNAYKNGKSVSEIYDAGLPRYAGGTPGELSWHNVAADLLDRFEGFRDSVYLDGKGIPTIGYGFTNSALINKGTITKKEAQKVLKKEISSRGNRVRNIMGAEKWDKLNDNTKAALLSYYYNYPAGFADTTKMMNAWRKGDYNEFVRQIDAGMNDKANPGLKDRRLEEQRIVKEDPFLFPVQEKFLDTTVAKYNAAHQFQPWENYHQPDYPLNNPAPSSISSWNNPKSPAYTPAGLQTRRIDFGKMMMDMLEDDWEPPSIQPLKTVAPPGSKISTFTGFKNGKLPRYQTGNTPITTTGGAPVVVPVTTVPDDTEANDVKETLERVAGFLPYVGTIQDWQAVVEGNYNKIPSAIIGTVADAFLPGLKSAYKAYKSYNILSKTAPKIVDKIVYGKKAAKAGQKLSTNGAYQAVGTYQDVLDDQGYMSKHNNGKLPQFEDGELPEYKNGKSSIHINPANRGKFNATKKRTGKTTEELAHSKNPLTRKRAIFALNARKWKH